MKHPVNPLTNQPGGVTLKIEFSNGTVKLQPRVKYPNKYISEVVATSDMPVVRVTDATNNQVLYGN